MRRTAFIVLGFIAACGGASAADKKPLTGAEMKTLLAKGLTVTSTDLQGGKQFSSRVNLAAGGKISGTLTVVGQKPMEFSGNWKLQGVELCRTLDPIQPEEVCETWLRSGNKEVIVQVKGKEVSMNRWQ